MKGWEIAEHLSFGHDSSRRIQGMKQGVLAVTALLGFTVGPALAATGREAYVEITIDLSKKAEMGGKPNQGGMGGMVPPNAQGARGIGGIGCIAGIGGIAGFRGRAADGGQRRDLRARSSGQRGRADRRRARHRRARSRPRAT